METQTVSKPVTDEQKLIGIRRRLPPERVSQVIDFAQFLEFHQQLILEKVQNLSRFKLLKNFRRAVLAVRSKERYNRVVSNLTLLN